MIQAVDVDQMDRGVVLGEAVQFAAHPRALKHRSRVPSVAVPSLHNRARGWAATRARASNQQPLTRVPMFWVSLGFAPAQTSHVSSHCPIGRMSCGFGAARAEWRVSRYISQKSPLPGRERAKRHSDLRKHSFL